MAVIEIKSSLCPVLSPCQISLKYLQCFSREARQTDRVSFTFIILVYTRDNLDTR